MTDPGKTLAHAGLAASYALLAYAGAATVTQRSPLGLLWPAAGVAVLWLMMQRTRSSWALCLAAIAIIQVTILVLIGLPVVVVFGLWAGAVVQAALVSWLASRWCPGILGGGGTGSIHDLGVLVRTAMAGLMGTALALVPVSVCLREASTQPLDLVLWWGAAVTGLLMTGAVGHLLWEFLSQGPKLRTPHFGWLELGALWMLTAAVLLRLGGSEHASAFLVIAPALWAALRFETVYAAAHVFLIDLVCVALTMAGRGPFAAIPHDQTAAASLLSFLLLTLLTTLAVATARDQRSAALAGLVASAELFKVMTEAMTEGLLVVDAEGRLVEQNGSARRLLSQTTAAGAQNIFEYPLMRADGTPLPTKEHPSVLARAERRVVSQDVVLPLANGEQRVLAITAAPLTVGLASEVELGVLKVYRDVTEERRQSRELAEFAGVVAHDLRSPLSATQGWLALAEDMQDHAALRKALSRARGGVDRMAVLIRDLLDQATAEGGELTSEPVQLSGHDGLVDDIAGIVDPNDDADISADEIPLVMGDPEMLRQLFTNLIGNSMKYVEPSTRPRIHLTGRAAGSRVHLELSDNGIGIPEDRRDLVFERFHRAHSDDERYSGTGLGLAICRTIVERHGGKILALPGPDGAGTVFRFDLPAAT